MAVTQEQLVIIGRLNNLPGKKDCIHCVGVSCWLATEATASALMGIFSMPGGYEACENAQVVAMTLSTLREMSQG